MVQRWNQTFLVSFQRFMGWIGYRLVCVWAEIRSHIVGHLSYIAACVLGFWAAGTEPVLQRVPLLQWLQTTSQPALGLGAFAITLISLVFVLLPYLKELKFGMVEIIVKGTGNRPLTLPAMGLIAGVAALLLVKPLCSPPAVFIDFAEGSTSVRVTPGQELFVQEPSSNLSAWSHTQGKSDLLVCRWSVLPGDSASIVSPTACDTTINWNERSSRTTLLVNVHKMTCEDAVNAQVYINP